MSFREKLSNVMTNIMKFFVNINYPLVILFAYTTKIIIFGTDFADAIALFPLVGLYGYNLFLTGQNIKDRDILISEIQKLKNVIQSVKLDKMVRREDGNKTRKRLF